MDTYQTAILSVGSWDWLWDLIFGKKSDGTKNGN